MGSKTALEIEIRGQDKSKQAFSSVNDSVTRMSQALASVAGFATLKDQMSKAVSASNELNNSMLGLSTVSRAFDVDAGSATSAAQALAADGLMSVRDSSEGLKNLLASGFGLDQAINLMNTFKDSAAFNRQGTLAFGEAIVGATQGIKNQNSIMVDNVGITKNLSNILKEQGLSVNDLSNVTSDANVRQKMYNGLMKEGSIFSGDAARSSQTLSGQQAALKTAVFNTRAEMGQLIGAGLSPMVGMMGTAISQNPQLAAALAMSGMAAAGAVVGVVALKVAFASLTVSMLPTIALFGALAAVVGIVAFKAIRDVQGRMAAATTTTKDNSAAVNDNKAAVTGLSKAQSDLKEKLDDIAKSVAKENRSFRESMAEMVKSHQDKVGEITDQIDEENRSFSEANDERVRRYRESMEEMVKSHERKVADITTDIEEEKAEYAKKTQEKLDDYKRKIDLERQAGTEVSKLKVADLQAQLAKELAEEKDTHEKKVAELQLRLGRENEDYTVRGQQLAEQNERDTAKEREEHEKRVTEMSSKLSKEKAFLDKHATDVESVRNVVLLDELEKLKRSHDESIASYADQAAKAKNSATEIGNNFGNSVSPEDQEKARISGENLGKGIASGMSQAFASAWKDWVQRFLIGWEGVKEIFKHPFDDNKVSDLLRKADETEKRIQQEQLLQGPNKNGTPLRLTGARAAGGPVSAGKLYQVNEKGPEYFVPGTDGHILPAGQAPGGGGVTMQLIVQGDLVVDSQEREDRIFARFSALLGQQFQEAANGYS